MSDYITINGISTNNLKNIDVKIKKSALNLIIGPSGSGKSSLAYDTIAQIGLHEYMSMFSDNLCEVAYKVKNYSNILPTVPLSQKNNNNNMRSTIGTYFGLNSKLATVFSAVLGVKEDYFVLNKEENECKCCHGLGFIEKIDISKIVATSVPLKDNPFRCWHRYNDFYKKIIKKYCDEKGIELSKTFDKLTNKEKNILLYGESKNKYQIIYKNGNSISSRTTKYYGIMTGIPMRKNYNIAKQFYSDFLCQECNGIRFSKDRLKQKVDGISIGEIMIMPFDKLESTLIKMNEKISDSNIRMIIISCLKFIEKANELNLGHLFLNRSIPTLSGGELQRLRMVQIFSSQLSNLLIVLDEPLAGLSGMEKEAVYNNIIQLLKKHTLLVVDHSKIFVKSADNIIALGEGSGYKGGSIIDTQKYLLSQKLNYPISRKSIKQMLNIKIKEDIYSYKGADIKVAKDCMNIISGASGIGKTTLLREYFLRYFDSYTYISQKQSGNNQNSCVATLLDISSDINKLFANKFSKSRDFFSNKSGKAGACLACDGQGYKEIGGGKLLCNECGGSGYNYKLKKYKLSGKSILDVYDMTINDAIKFFITIDKKIEKQLYIATKLSLGHLKVGQQTTFLSGGENIRLKLIKLQKTKSQVLGIDEPFKGLNASEIFMLMEYLTKLRDMGKTIIVVDHSDIVYDYFDKHIVVGVKSGIIVEQ